LFNGGAEVGVIGIIFWEYIGNLLRSVFFTQIPSELAGKSSLKEMFVVRETNAYIVLT
jgi:hypothetical protein